MGSARSVVYLPNLRACPLANYYAILFKTLRQCRTGSMVMTGALGSAP